MVCILKSKKFDGVFGCDYPKVKNINVWQKKKPNRLNKTSVLIFGFNPAQTNRLNYP